MTIITENIPADLKALDHWVRWRQETPPGRKPTKLPYDCNGGSKAESDNPQTWSSFDVALAAYQRENKRYNGIGYVFSPDDAYCGIDLDDCIVDAVVSPEAAEIIHKFSSYTEVSPSGNGVKIFCKATLPEGYTGKQTTKVTFERLEVYDRGRYFTVTGDHLEGTPTTIEERQEAADWLIQKYWRSYPVRPASAGTYTNTMPGAIDVTTRKPHAKPPPVITEAIVERCRNAVMALPDAISGKGGHNATIKAACECYRFGLGDDQAMQVMQWFNELKTGGERWTDAELKHKIEDAKKKVEAEGQIGIRVIGDTWEEPTPLGEITLPDFPTAALGTGLSDYAEAVAESLQVAVDMPGVLILAVGGAVLARRFDIHVRADHFEPLNIYAAVIAEPGERKSAVFREVTAALTVYEIEQAELMAADIEQNTTDRNILEGAIKSTETKASKTTDPIELVNIKREIAKLKERLRETPPMVSPRILADDVTQQRIVGLMQLYGGQIAVMSPEGGVFEQMYGKFSKTGMPDLDVYLKGHAGDDIRVDRIGRAPEWVRNPALTMGLAVQPEVVRGLLSKPALRGRGLLARFFYSWPKSKVGYREIDSFAVPESARDEYQRMLQAAMRLPLAEPRSTAARVGTDALDVLDGFAADVERDLRPDGRFATIRDWGTKSVGLVCRIAGILHGLRNSAGGTPHTIHIDGQTMADAVMIGQYAAEHAIGTFIEMGSSPEIEMARHILKWIKDERLATFTKREAHRKFEKRCQTVDKIEAPLDLLVKHGYVREVEKKKAPHRTPDEYEVHPKLRESGDEVQS